MLSGIALYRLALIIRPMCNDKIGSSLCDFFFISLSNISSQQGGDINYEHDIITEVYFALKLCRQSQSNNNDAITKSLF